MRFAEQLLNIVKGKQLRLNAKTQQTIGQISPHPLDMRGGQIRLPIGIAHHYPIYIAIAHPGATVEILQQ